MSSILFSSILGIFTNDFGSAPIGKYCFKLCTPRAKITNGIFATHKTGDILARFTDSNKIIDALASTVISMFLDVGTVLVIGWVLALQNLRLFGLTLLAIPFTY